MCKFAVLLAFCALLGCKTNSKETTNRWNGFVDVVFTVSAEGEVVDASIQRTNLSQAFQNEALRAVRAWHFKPVVEADAAPQRRYSVRIDFKANEAFVKQSSTP